MELSTILFVEDEPQLLNLYTGGLEKKGYQVLRASSGSQAKNVLTSRKEAMGYSGIDLIVSDWMMEPVNGLELLTFVREEFKFEEIPFLLISGAVTREELTSAISLDADAVLLKPFVLEDLLKKIEEAYKNRETKKIQNTSPLPEET